MVVPKRKQKARVIHKLFNRYVKYGLNGKLILFKY